jgi:superfamily II DNA or RNA helicase
MIEQYREFIRSKGLPSKSHGFKPQGKYNLFPHQLATLQFACEKGRSAAFLDTGLGKSRVEAAAAAEFAAASGRPSLILTPLAVASQMARECAAIGIEATIVADQQDVRPGVNIANYEKLPKLDPTTFGGVVLDESSILKNFIGKFKQALTEGFSNTPYRLAATATPAPNDVMELCNHAEFLGLMTRVEILSRWFVNDTSIASQKWRLKGHAYDDFWQWVSSWSRSATLPSDLGGNDENFILPPLMHELHIVEADITTDVPEGFLFRIPDNSATTIHREKRLTLDQRVAKSAELANNATGSVIVWCQTNEESSALAAAIPDSVEVCGSMPIEQKIKALDSFTFGEKRVIVSKPKIAGLGLNWQHANTVIFSSLNHQYEAYYQAIRRAWRFGQTKPVTCHVVISHTESSIWDSIRRKSADHSKMKQEMAKSMNGYQRQAGKIIYSRTSQVTLPKFFQ